MVSKQQKGKMLDYLVAKLEKSEERIRPVKKEIVSGIESSYILLDDDGIVLLVDQYYPKGKLATIYSKGKQKFPKFGIVFLKDGKTFFRSASAANYFKKEHELSLKYYDNDAMQKMMLLRPEEIFVNELSDRAWVQYYQPESQKLKESVVSFKFGIVEFDYSHIPNGQRFGPITQDSKRLFIWHEKVETQEDLILRRSHVIERSMGKT